MPRRPIPVAFGGEKPSRFLALVPDVLRIFHAARVPRNWGEVHAQLLLGLLTMAKGYVQTFPTGESPKHPWHEKIPPVAADFFLRCYLEAPGQFPRVLRKIDALLSRNNRSPESVVTRIILSSVTEPLMENLSAKDLAHLIQRELKIPVSAKVVEHARRKVREILSKTAPQ